MRSKKKRKPQKAPKHIAKKVTKKKLLHPPVEPELLEEPTVFTVCRGTGGSYHFKSSLPNSPDEFEIWLQATVFPLGTEIVVKYP